jgi:hypothetical protein
VLLPLQGNRETSLAGAHLVPSGDQVARQFLPRRTTNKQELGSARPPVSSRKTLALLKPHASMTLVTA